MKLSDILLDGIQQEGTESLNIRQTINKYLRRWYYFGFGILFCLSVGFFYLYTATPQYSVTSTILIRDNEQGSNFSKNALYNDLENYNSVTKVENEIEILKSKRLMQKVLSELSLNVTYNQVEGYLNKREIYGRDLPFHILITYFDSSAFKDKIEPLKLHLIDDTSFNLEIPDKQSQFCRFGEEIKLSYCIFSIIKNPVFSGFSDESPNTIEISFNNLKGMAEAYATGMTVELVNKQASAVSIELISSIPQKGIDIVSNLVTLYNREAIEDKNLAALNTIEFIDERLKYLTSELSDVEKSVEKYKGVQGITDVDSEAQIYLQSSSDYKKRLSELEIQVAVIESMESYLRSQKDQYQVIPSSLTIENPTFTSLVNTYNEMQMERQRMLQNYLPSNPLVVNLNAQLHSLREDILQNLESIKSSLEIARGNLQSSSSLMQSRVQRVPKIERELLEISRQQGIKQEHYLYLLKKREEAAIMLSATTVSNSRIIDPARSSIKPVKPNKFIVIFLSLTMGILLPLIYIEIRDLLNDKVQWKEDIQRKTKIPVLGEISHNKKDGILAISEKRRTPIAEQFRLVRSNLQFAMNGKENKVILITSTVSGEGKTFIGINLSKSLSMIGKKVVMVEFDLRKPALLSGLGIKNNELGVSDYLNSEDLSATNIVRRLQNSTNLYIIGSGPIPADPAELMLSIRVGQLINELKEKFDHVIIDSAPIGQVADAYSLAEQTDLLVYIVRSNYTLKSQVNYINDINQSKKFKNPLIILNDVKTENSPSFSYGYGYG